jgi:predicted lactoylglutathione lyase
VRPLTGRFTKIWDLRTSVEFFTSLGFTFDPRFTDDKATCMIVSDRHS